MSRSTIAWRRRLSIALVPLGVFTAMCSKPTGLVVSVDTDLAIGTDIDEVVISVAREGETTPKDKRATLGAPGSPTFPLSLGVETGDGVGVVVVTARGLLRGQEIVTRTARVVPTKGEERLLALDLCASCRRSTCAAPLTCAGDGSCIDVAAIGTVYEGEELPRHTCGRPPPNPVVEAGADAASTTDGATDAPVDAGADACARCPTGTVCGNGFCELLPTAGTDCGNGVDVSLGATIRGKASGNAIEAACNTAGAYTYTLRVFQTKALPPGVTAWLVSVKRLSGVNVASKVIPQNVGCQAEFQGCIEADNVLTVGPNAKFVVGGRNGNSQDFELAFTPKP